MTALAVCLAACAPGCEATIGDAPVTGQRDATPASGSDASASVNDASTPLADATPTADATVPDAEPPPDARPACDGGDSQVTDPETGACYELYGVDTGGESWEDARAFCEGVDAYLVAITSAQEDELVLELVVDTSDVHPDYWLGGFQDPRGEEDEPAERWQWVTGDPIGKDDPEIYDGWRSNEPNDGGENGEDCMIMEGDVGGTWDDRGCTDRYPFVCERP